MLILTRRLNETICIGDDIRITVLGVRGGEIRFGIDAPREIPVDREEIAKLKQAERRMGRERVAGARRSF